jgi:16S rRNA processing protein RimM
MQQLKYLSVGYVIKPQGIRGEVKVEPLTDDMYRFNSLKEVFIKKGHRYEPVKILDRKYVKNAVILQLEGYRDRNQAEALRGEYLWVSREQALPLPEDSYYIADIVGCRVETSHGRFLGNIVSVLHTASNDVYVVKKEGNEEILIPALKKVVVRVNLENKNIVVNPDELEGLLPDED